MRALRIIAIFATLVSLVFGTVAQTFAQQPEVGKFFLKYWGKNYSDFFVECFGTRRRIHFVTPAEIAVKCKEAATERGVEASQYCGANPERVTGVTLGRLAYIRNNLPSALFVFLTITHEIEHLNGADEGQAFAQEVIALRKVLGDEWVDETARQLKVISTPKLTNTGKRFFSPALTAGTHPSAIEVIRDRLSVVGISLPSSSDMDTQVYSLAVILVNEDRIPDILQSISYAGIATTSN